jgi:predicted metalloprotease with PDZ domain
VKRLRPKALGPFDYDGPVRTKSLWISEGITNYYTNVILSRAGLNDEAQFIAGYEQTIGGFLAIKGYRTISPEEASWTVWDSTYMSNPVSYYTQGEILGLLMDLEIRGQTKNQKSLDDGMKLLYQRFSGKSGFQSEDVVSTIFDATGVDLHDFFLKHVSAAQPIEWQKYFRHMGYLARMSRNPRVAISFESLTGGDDGVIIKVFQDSALARIGLKNDDVIKAFNGRPVKTGGELQQILRTLEVGAAMDFTVKRAQETVSVKGAVEAATDVAELLGRRGSRMAVTRLDPESPAALSGLANGDVIKAVNGTPVADRDQYHAAVGKVTDGEVVKFTVDRGGTEQVIEHRATQSVTTNFRLTPDPSASPLELEIRRALILGPAKSVAETRPAKRAG